MALTNKVVKMTIIYIGKGNAMALDNKLKEYRAGMNINQRQLGAMVGVSRQTISLIERGDYNPSVTLAIKIAKVFGAGVEEIFIYSEEMDI